MNLAPGWVLFSYTLLRKELHIIPRKFPESIGSIYSIPIDQLHPHPDNPFGIRDDPSMLEFIENVREIAICPANQFATQSSEEQGLLRIDATAPHDYSISASLGMGVHPKFSALSNA